MKVAVSIPDDVFAEAERLARRLGTSRSALYAAALRDVVARHDVAGLAAWVARYNATLADPAVVAGDDLAAAQLRRVEW